MKKITAAAVLLSLVLSPSAPAAHALRLMSPSETLQKTGLEDALNVSQAGAEEAFPAFLKRAREESWAGKAASQAIADFVRPLVETQNRALSPTGPSRAKQITLQALLGVIGGDMTAAELLTQATGMTVEATVGGQKAKYRERLADPIGVLRSIGIIGGKVWEAYQEEETLGVPAAQPLDGSLGPEEYLRRFRARMVRDGFRSRTDPYTTFPFYRLGFQEEINLEDLSAPTPFGLLSILAARQFGQRTTLRCFPEFSEILLENGVEDVLFLPPAPNSPPALLVRFRKPHTDPRTEETSQAVAVALLKTPWPNLPAEPSTPWAGMTDDQLFETALSSLSQEREAVEFDEAAVRALAFQPEDPPLVRARKALELTRLAAQGLLVPRWSYLVDLSDTRAERYARWVTRTDTHRQAAVRYLNFERDRMLRERPYLAMPAPKPEVQKKFLEGLDVQAQGLGLLEFLGAAELAQDPEAVQRAQQIISALTPRKGTFDAEIWRLYRPLLALPLARTAQGWLLSPEDTSTLVNRLDKSQEGLKSPDALAWAQRAAPFRAEMNHAALRGDLLARPFRTTPMPEAHAALRAAAVRLLGPEADRSPTALSLRQEEQTDLRRREDSARQTILQNLEAGPLEPLVRTLEELETVSVRLGQGGGLPSGLALASVSFRNKANTQKGLAEVERTVEAVAAVSVQPAGPAGDPVLELFRALVAVRRARDEGRLQEALKEADRLLAQAQPGELPALQEFRGVLADRIEREDRKAREERRRQAEAVVTGLLELVGAMQPGEEEQLLPMFEKAIPKVAEFKDLQAQLKKNQSALQRTVAAAKEGSPLEVLQKSEDRQAVARVLLSDPFKRFRTDRLVVRLLDQTQQGPITVDLGRVRTGVTAQLRGSSGDESIFYHGVLRLLDLLSAGTEELLPERLPSLLSLTADDLWLVDRSP